jgi:sugar-specific transcriptional regulator TrmB
MPLVPLSEKLVKELMSFGLSGNEAKVYLALLQLKKASARAIARLSNIPRQETYRVLPRLEKLGMIEVIIDKPTKFFAINPEEVLSELIKHQQEVLSSQISELREKKTTLESELKKVEGKSAGLAEPEPIHFALISGQRLINEKIREMLQNAKSEVLWIAPNMEIRRAIIYDRDRMLRKCAQRNIKIRIVTEIDEKNLKEVDKLSDFCEIRHSAGVTSLATLVDNKELIMGSAIYPGGSFADEGLMHELWTNDSSHIGTMKDLFEKVWQVSLPAELEMSSIRSGKAIQPIVVVQGTEDVKKQLFDSLARAQSKLFIVSRIDNESISLMAPQLERLRKKNVSMRWVTVVDEQNVEIVQNLAGKVNLRVVEERPISFMVTDSECLFASSPVLRTPHEMVWSIDSNVVNVFWALAEEIWADLSRDIANL